LEAGGKFADAFHVGPCLIRQLAAGKNDIPEETL